MQLREDPEAAVTLVGHLAQQVQALRGRIELLNVKSARDRVLGYLHSRLGASATAVELDRTWKAIASMGEAILDGRQPKGVGLAELLASLASASNEQRANWGFGPSAPAPAAGQAD